MIVIRTLKTMPIKCEQCPCFYDEGDFCAADVGLYREVDERPEWCPLYEVDDNVYLSNM